MKIQHATRFVAMALIPLVFIACQSDTEPSHIDYPENARLIRVLNYHGLQAQDHASLEEYEYDGDGKLIKKSRPSYRNGERAGISDYDAYEYDPQNRLIKIASFNYNINGGFTNSKNILFTYDSKGNKERETIEFPKINSTEHIIFYHDGYGRLILKEHFNSQNVSQGYHVFEYSARGQMMGEKIYNAQQQLMRKHIHHYENGNNTEIKVFVGGTDELLRKITKTFDRNKNLILLQSEEMAIYSSATSYTQKFEYE